MKKIMGIAVISVLSILLLGCGGDKAAQGQEKKEASVSQTHSSGEYKSIQPEEVKKMMDDKTDFQLVDVRTKEEYDAGHIHGAILIPLDTIGKEKPESLPNSDAKIIVYCCSGSRSKMAAEKLLALGYSDVLDMGGINSWTYDIEK